MKRTVSILLALSMLLACMPLTLAADKAPYSLEYLENIDGAEYIIYTDYPDEDHTTYTLTQRTLEAYDANELAASVEYDWEKIIEPFIEAFKEAGFRESLSFVPDSETLVYRYVYRLENEIFTIYAEAESELILERKGVVFILHEHRIDKNGGSSSTEDRSDAYTGSLFAGIRGISLYKVYAYEPMEKSSYKVLQRTLEVYTVDSLMASVGNEWDKIIKPFRDALLDAGYAESGPSDTGAYTYFKGDEYFSLLGEKESHDLQNTTNRVYVKHEIHAPLDGLPEIDFTRPLTAQEAADWLHAYGLFAGVGDNEDGTPNYDLFRAPNRFEGIAMLVRLLGKEDEAFAGDWENPFTDVDDWAKGYVGYAYANGLTYGISDTKFGGKTEIGASQYLTFVLRALGYKDGEDFQWDSAWELTDKLGITDGTYNDPTRPFLRGDVVAISFNALFQNIKGTNTKLIDTLKVR